MLEQYGIPFPRSHDLTALEALLPASLQVATAGLNLGLLNDWAVVARYPDFTPVASLQDARQACQVAESAFTILAKEIT